MIRIKKIFLMVVCAGILNSLILTACNQLPEKTYDEIDYKQFISDLQEERKSLVVGEIPIEEIEKCKPTHTIRREIGEEEFILLTQPKEKELMYGYTKEEIHQDVDIMFDLFENFYGAYVLFGGAERFDQVKEKIKEQIDSDMSISQMTNIILDELSIFPDGPMAFNQINVYPKQKTYMVKDFYVRKSRGDLFIEDENGIFQILHPEKWDDYIKPTIDDEGKLAYAFFKRVSSEEKIYRSDQIKILDHEGQEDIKTFQWKNLKSNIPKAQLTLSEKTEDEISIQKISSYSDDKRPIYELEKEFASYGERAFKEPSMILDLRGNSGGYSGPPKMWSKPFLGDNTTSKKLVGGVFNRLYKFHPNTRADLDEEFLDKYLDGNWKSHSVEGQWVENDKWILILSDDGVASAAEEFILLLHQMDSSIIIGILSRGCNMIGENSAYYLPDTGTSIYFGSILSFAEEIGDDSTSFIEPDIWVDPDEAEEKAILFMKYYQIGQEE